MKNFKLFFLIFIFVFFLCSFVFGVTLDNYFPLINPSVNEPDNQIFNISVSDAESDPLNVSWYFDEMWQKSDTDVTNTNLNYSEWNYTGNYTSAGTYNVSVNISDGVDELWGWWTLTVLDNTTVNIINFAPNTSFCVMENTIRWFNITFLDDDNDSIDVNWYLNGVLNISNDNFTLINVPDGTYNVSVSVSDGSNFNWTEWIFYVTQRTVLDVNPLTPNGLNSWYITEPLFTLQKDSSVGLNSYYRWDSTGNLLYTGSFDLEDIPNPPNVSAGILELTYWSDFNNICGNESEQNQTFKIDLTNPVIKDLSPGNQSIVYNDLRPRISAYLDEIYSSNSGIDNTSIIMTLDSNIVNPSIGVMSSIDAILRYTPDVDLSEGIHTVYVYVEDNAGRQSELSWDFNISVTSIANMIVISPENKSYGEKRILLNVSLDSGEIGLLEVMDNKDVKPKWKKLCKNCDSYGKLLSFKDGQHDLRIKVTDAFGFVNEQNISFEVDSKKPVINKIEPKNGAVTNGESFKVKYSEENLRNVILVVENNENILSYCEAGKNKECSASLDLSAYDGEWVDYWFNVSDYVGEVQSKVYSIKIDTTDPVITLNLPTNNFDYDSNKIGIDVQLSEKVKRLEYIDYEDSRAKWKMLCNKCSYYNKTKNFKNGPHDLDVRAIDEAGNFDLENVKFII